MISLVDRYTSAYNTITYKLENTSFKDKKTTNVYMLDLENGADLRLRIIC